MESLIKTIEKYPCLWKSDSEEYKSPNKKAEAWNCVVNECDEVDDIMKAKHLWKILRDGYRQALSKKKNCPGEHEGFERLWKYEKVMDFLRPYVTTRSKYTNTVFIEDDAENWQLMTENSENDSEIESSHLKVRRGIKRRNSEGTISDFLKNDNKRILPTLNVEETDNTTVMTSFFESIHDMCKPLPEDLQMNIQKQIFNIVMEAREENLERKRNVASSSGVCLYDVYQGHFN